MQKILYIAIPIFFFFSACKTSKISKPTERYLDRAAQPVSTLNLPIRIAIKELEQSINKQLEGVIYEDDTFEDGDNLMVKAEKVNDIHLSVDSSLIKYQVPLKLWIKYDAGFTTLEANGDIELQFKTAFSIQENWAIQTETELVDHKWLKTPRVRFAGMNLPVGFIANLVINTGKTTIVRSIDDMVQENLKLEELIKDSWEEMFEPIFVSPEYNAWLTVNPQSMGLTELALTEDTLGCTVVVLSKPQITLGEKPQSLDRQPLPPFQYIDRVADDFLLNLNTEISFTEAERISKDQLLGETFSQGSRSVTIEDMKLYGQDEKLIIETKLSGSYEGNIFLEGIPYYNTRKNSIDIDDLEYTLDTRSFLYRSAGWLLRSAIKNQIKDNLNFLLEYNLEEMKNQIQDQLTSYPITNEIFLQGNLQELSIQNAYLTSEAIGIDIALQGKLSLMIKGLN